MALGTPITTVQPDAADRLKLSNTLNPFEVGKLNRAFLYRHHPPQQDGAGLIPDKLLRETGSGDYYMAVIDDRSHPFRRKVLLRKNCGKAIGRGDHGQVVDDSTVAEHRNVHTDQKSPIKNAREGVGDKRPACRIHLANCVRDGVLGQGRAKRAKCIDEFLAARVCQEDAGTGISFHN